MPIDPDYGTTPISDDDAQALTEDARDALGDTPNKLDVYDLEQSAQRVVTEDLIRSVLDDDLHLEHLVTDHFLRELHTRLYGDVWQWAGRFRRRETSIGIDPDLIAVELRASLDTLLWRWTNTTDWTAHEFGLAVHAETVRIHPFVDGNGRTTRLLADLVLLAAQDRAQPPSTYSWNIDKSEYIRLLQQYDRDRQPAALAHYIGAIPVTE